MAGTIDKIKAKVENVLHKDKDTTHDTTHTGTHTGTTGAHTTGLHGSTHSKLFLILDAGKYLHSLDDPTGPHSSHAANVADPRVDSDRIGGAGNTAGAGGYGTTGSGLTGSHGTTGHSTTHGSDPTGPHDSRLANKLDPRVDSDRVGPAGNSASAGGYGNESHSSGQHTYQTDGKKLPDALLEDKSRADHHSGAGLTHSSHTNTGSGLTGSHTHGSDPTGPHDSHLANKVDPRVDSDRYGAAGNTASAGGYGSTGSGLTGSHTGSNTYGSDPTGPHDSHLANKADPRVDSDRYGAAGNTASAGGYGSTGSGLTGSHTGSHTGSNTYASDPTGPHDSHLANKADPRVDSDRYGGQGNTYGTTQGSGLTGSNHPGHVGNPNTNKTAGPHGSDVLNKLDPRVDSDLDGSKKIGGDRTYG